MRLSKQRVLVVGASSGIGRAVVQAAVGEGARVVAAARREERLAELASELGTDVTPMTCDVRDADACAEVVEQTVARLGGLDAVVYAAGIATLSPIHEADREVWRECLEINLVGASLVTAAALPHLRESLGRIVYLSSISADDKPPRAGLGLYITAKAALNRMIDVWRAEHGDVGFCRISVGDTLGTEMATDWNPALGQEMIQDWVRGGYLYNRMMMPDAVARHVMDVLAFGEALPETHIVPRQIPAEEG